MLDSLLKYDFPKGGSDPFDINADGNYFVFANAYSNLSKDLGTFSFAELEKHIPMGYKTIVICHRLLLIDQESKLVHWNFAHARNTGPGSFSGKYLLTTDKQYNKFIPEWDRNIQTFVIYKPGTTDASLSSSAWNDYESCKKFASQNSPGLKCRQLISIIIDTINWH